MRSHNHHVRRLIRTIIVFLAILPLPLIVHIAGPRGQYATLTSYLIILGAAVGLAHVIARLLYVTEQKHEIERAKDEFLSFASHQLRTPLTTMNWRLEMLLQGDAGKLSKNQEGYIKEIEAETRRMTQLVNTFLNVSRINLGTLTIHSEPCDVSSIIDSVLQGFYRTLESKKITVKKHYARRCVIPCDQSIVRMIIQNLLSNAVKYTHPRGRIAVMTERQGNELVVTVADTGVGIPLSAQPSIFTKLFRASNAQKESPDGNGIGLYIVRSLLNMTGGRIWFESEENKGSRFFVALPFIGMKQRLGNKTLAMTRS